MRDLKITTVKCALTISTEGREAAQHGGEICIKRAKMGSFSPSHWLVVLAVILLLLVAGKLPRVMGDLAKGIKSFRAGMKDDEDVVARLEDAGEPTDRKAIAPADR
jgi:sec-independent protein translocase protein TatA